MHKTLVKSAVLTSVMFGVGTANAEVITFENPAPGEPGHFEWTAVAGQEFLTILAGPEGQPGTALEEGTFWRRDQVGGTTIRGWSGQVEQARFSDPAGHILLFVVDAGDIIPSPVIPEQNDGFFNAGFIFAVNIDPGWPSTQIPEGKEVFLGVSFDLGNGTQYGWIGLVRTGTEVDAFAWGYETEPGVPIEAGAGLDTPCPGDLAGSGGEAADGIVNFEDLLALFGMWGPCPAPPSECPGDLTEPADGTVNFDDLLALFAECGECE